MSIFCHILTNITSFVAMFFGLIVPNIYFFKYFHYFCDAYTA